VKKPSKQPKRLATNGHAPADKATNISAPADTIPFDQGEVKNNLDLAWGKIQNGLQQEAQGYKLWIEGTLELINIPHDARQCHASDQAFGKRLTDSGYGENRIKRHERSALLNMAEHPDLTRKVLEQTHSRSWQLIWRDEIRPRLPNARQPTDGEEPEAATRRSKKNGAKKPDGRRIWTVS
jgi:hypothetical protein